MGSEMMRTASHTTPFTANNITAFIFRIPLQSY